MKSMLRQAERGLADMSDDLRSGLGEIGAAVAAEGAALRSEIHEVKHDLTSVRARVEECRTENMAFFDSFMGSIEATQEGVDVLRVRNLRPLCSPQPIVLHVCLARHRSFPDRNVCVNSQNHRWHAVNAIHGATPAAGLSTYYKRASELFPRISFSCGVGVGCMRPNVMVAESP